MCPTDDSKWYRGFGLRFRSAYPLPLPEDPDSGAPVESDAVDIHVTLSDDPPRKAVAVRRRSWTRTDQAGVLVFEDDGGYCLRVRVDASGQGLDVHFNRAAEDLSCVLVGAAAGALLRMRGQTALHATTVVSDDAAIAIAGRAGAGKSTLAALLNAAGAACHADDVTAVTWADGQVMALPGGPLRLAPETAARLASVFGAVVNPPATDGKHSLMPLAGGICVAPVRLARIVIVEGRRRDIDSPIVERVTPSAACVSLTEFLYGADWLPIPVGERLAVCSRLATHVSVVRVWLPDDFDRAIESRRQLRRVLCGELP